MWIFLFFSVFEHIRNYSVYVCEKRWITKRVKVRSTVIVFTSDFSLLTLHENSLRKVQQLIKERCRRRKEGMFLRNTLHGLECDILMT